MIDELIDDNAISDFSSVGQTIIYQLSSVISLVVVLDFTVPPCTVKVLEFF